MSASDVLLTQLDRLDATLDFIGPSGNCPPAVLDTALRGIAVQGLAIFEEFVRVRSRELVAKLEQARLSPTSFAVGVSSISDRIVQTLPSKFKNTNAADRLGLIDDLAKTLSSFNSGSIVPHQLFFGWPGSNIQHSDVETIAKIAGVTRGWEDLTAMWSRIDPSFPGNSSLKNVFETVADTRHEFAHDASKTADYALLSTIPSQVRTLACVVDVTLSGSVALMCSRAQAPPNLSKALQLRVVHKRGARWADVGSVRRVSDAIQKRARKLHDEQSAAVDAAYFRVPQAQEAVIALDDRRIVTWRAPA